MKKTLIASAVTIVALTIAVPLQAHHSISMFDISKPIWVKGTVVSYVPANPHVLIALDEEKPNGQPQRWIVDGPTLARLGRMNLPAEFLRAGDVIEVCGFPFKQEVLARSDGAQRPSVHGQVLVMPDGHMQPWGPYGKIENCVRPNDRTEPWLEFLNTYPMARQYWCDGRTYVKVATVASPAFIDETNRRLATPCE